MADQTSGMKTKEYHSVGGVLIVENITKGDRKKSDIVREIIRNLDFPGVCEPIQPVCGNAVGRGSNAGRN